MGQSSGGARQLEGCLKDVTLPTRLEAEFDSIIPLILEVQTIRRRPQRQGEGNKDATLPAKLEVEVDSSISLIVEVEVERE